MTIQASKFITLSTAGKASAWEALLAEVEQTKAANSNEKIYINFALVQLSESNEYLAKLIMDDQVVFECIKGNTTHKLLDMTALVLLHDNKKREEKFKLQVLDVVKTLSKKELETQKRLKTYRNAITSVLDTKAGSSSVFVKFADIAKDCGFNNMLNVCKGLNNYFEELCSVCSERNITDIMVSMRDVLYNANLIDTFFKTAIRIFKDAGIKLTFTDCTDELNSKLRLHMKYIYNNGKPEEVLNFVKELGIGRVVLLTKLKDHDTKDTHYREEDEVVAQFIAIVNQISDDVIQFKYIGFAGLQTFHDKLAYYGSPDEFEDELFMHIVDIPLEELGCTGIRIAKSWHLNLLNGDVAGSGEFNYVNTYTSETITALPQEESVVLPEFIRRSLRSWHVRFNERATLIDVTMFKKKLKNRR